MTREGFFAKLQRGADALVGLASPEQGLRRQGLRAMGDRLSRLSSDSYDGATKSRRWTNKKTGAGSADADLDESSLHSLRERSRDRERNDPAAHAALNSLTDNVVGFGLRPQLRLDHEKLGITEDRARELAKEAFDAWDEWGEQADSTNRLSIQDIQAQAFASMNVNGDVFARPLMVQDARIKTTFELRLEIIEADRVDTPLGIQNNRIRSGVELGAKRGEPVAYWISRAHPGDVLIPGKATVGSRKFDRVPAFNRAGRPNVLHLFHQERPGQSRGRPYLSIILNTLKDRSDYREAELIAAEVAACFSAFITKSDPWAAALARTTSDTTGKSERHEELSPGLIAYLAPGESIEFGNPSRPNAVFESFLKAISREVTSALGMPYEIAMRDFSGTTYSQARAALLEARRMFQKRQRWLVQHFLVPVWRMLLEEAWLKGRFGADDFAARQRDWTRAVWTPPAWGWVDPDKESKAFKLALDMGVITRQDIIATRSDESFEDVTRRLAEEDALRKKLGMDAPEPKPEPEPEPEEEEEEEEDEEPAEEPDEDGGDEAEDDEKQTAARAEPVEV